MPQMQLPFFPDGATEINQNLGFMNEGEDVTYIYGHLPVFTHHVDDTASFKMITSQMYVNGITTQAEICRAFGVTAISVKRSVKRYKSKGPAGFYEPRGHRGAAVLTPSVLGQVQAELDAGKDISEASEQLGLKKDTVRKAVKSGRLHQVSKKKKTQWDRALLRVQKAQGV